MPALVIQLRSLPPFRHPHSTQVRWPAGQGDYSERPPRHGYHLTQAGWELAPVLVLLLGWGDRWANDAVPVVLEHDGPDGRHDLEPVVTCRQCGAAVEAGALHARTADGTVHELGA